MGRELNNKKILILPIFAFLILAISLSNHYAYATLITLSNSGTCLELGGIWTNPNHTCTIPDFGSTTIGAGDILNIDPNITLFNQNGIHNILGIINNKGTISGNLDQQYDNAGQFNNFGTFDISGTFTNENNPGNIFNNYGTINLSGTINNFGILNNTCPGVIFAKGSGGTIDGNPPIGNSTCTLIQGPTTVLVGTQSNYTVNPTVGVPPFKFSWTINTPDPKVILNFNDTFAPVEVPIPGYYHIHVTITDSANNQTVVQPLRVTAVNPPFELQLGDSNGNCGLIGGTWNSGNDTCTVSNLGLGSFNSLIIDSGVDLTSHGTANSTGPITINGTITNEGILVNSGHMIINLGGTLENNQGSTITNNPRTTIDNYDTIDNSGSISNYGTINNNFGDDTTISNNPGSTFTNNPGGVLVTRETLENSGTFNNFGNLENTNLFQNDPDATIVNSGSIDNPGHITNLSGATFDEACNAKILENPVDNSGILNNISCLRITNTSVTPTPSSAALSSTITFHARVADTFTGTKTTPSGAVIWSDGGAGGHFSSSTCTLTTASPSVSTCAITYTAPTSTGPVTITGTYSGDTTHKTSSSSSSLTVTLRNTATTVTPNPSSVVHSGHIAFHVTIADISTGTKSTPTGTVSWSDGGAGGHFSSSSCTLTAASSTASTCSVVYAASSSTGTVTITATYLGDSNHLTSSGKSTLTVS